MSIIDKIKKNRQEVVRDGLLIGDDSFGEDHPGIFEMLVRVAYQGKPRQPGRLVMYAEPNRATLCLVDVDAGMVTFYTAETFGDALEGLERALQAGSCDWRKDKRSRS